MSIKKTNLNKTNSKLDDAQSIIVVYSGAHPAHQKMLADCCTSSIKMLGEWSVDKPLSNTKKLLAYLSTAYRLRSNPTNLIIIEGTTPTILMAPLIKCFNHHSKSVVALCADDALYSAFVLDKKLLQALVRKSFSFISGIISIGDLIAKLAQENLKPLPIETRYPPIAESKLNSLSKLKPSLDSHNLILIGGRSAHYKGVDIAAECTRILQTEFPDVNLTILGFPDIKKQPGISSPGPVEDIGHHLSSASVLIHPGRGDSFPVATIEAMLAGVVPFVSEWTGTSALIQKVSPELVVPLQAEEFAERIKDFWNAPAEYRNALSDKCRQVAKDFYDQVSNQSSLKTFIEDLRLASSLSSTNRLK